MSLSKTTCEPVVLPDDLLSRPVEGLKLAPGTLADQLDPAGTLLVFLRHFGCIFCREMVADLRKVSSSDGSFPRVLLFFQGTVEQGREFFAGRWPEARAVADLPKYFYERLGLTRGSVRQMFGPRAWACGFRAMAKGHFVGMKVIGDPWLMPGVFLVRERQIVWKHDFDQPGDHPDWNSIPRRG